ncbi:MAG: LysE family translocator, partial [Acidobacteria bacterium]
MFDARFFTYVTIAALLVMSPGPTMAVVMETAIGKGRVAALRTVLGINIANSSLALASALGLSTALHYWSWAMDVLRIGGAVYLTWLGVRALWSAIGLAEAIGLPEARSPKPEAPARREARAPVVRGILTNLLNPPVVLFYTVLLPQFIGPGDPFLLRFALLAAVHVSMSLAWLSLYAFALGLLAERLARPGVRRALEAVTGALLVGFGAKL